MIATNATMYRIRPPETLTHAKEIINAHSEESVKEIAQSNLDLKTCPVGVSTRSKRHAEKPPSVASINHPNHWDFFGRKHPRGLLDRAWPRPEHEY